MFLWKKRKCCGWLWCTAHDMMIHWIRCILKMVMQCVPMTDSQIATIKNWEVHWTGIRTQNKKLGFTLSLSDQKSTSILYMPMQLDAFDHLQVEIQQIWLFLSVTWWLLPTEETCSIESGEQFNRLGGNSPVSGRFWLVYCRALRSKTSKNCWIHKNQVEYIIGF